MNVIKIVGFVYGIFLIVGGFIGLKAGSKISLVMGILSGFLALLSSFLVSSNFIRATGLLMIVSGVLCVVFFLRLQKTGHFMPAGMLLGLSAIVFIIGLTQLFSK